MEFLSLIDKSLENLGVTVTLVNCRVGRQEVQVLLAFNVPNVDTLGSFGNDGNRVVVVAAEIVFHSDKVVVGLGIIEVLGGSGEDAEGSLGKVSQVL